MPYQTEGQLKSQDRVNQLKNRLEIDVQKQFADFTAAHGQEMIKDIKLLTDAFFALAGALVKLAENTHAISLVSKLIESLAGTANTTATLIGGTDKERSAMVHKKISEMHENDKRPLSQKLGFDKIWGDVEGYKRDIGGPMPSSVSNSSNNVGPTTVNNVWNIDGAKSPQETASHIQKIFIDTKSQIPLVRPNG